MFCKKFEQIDLSSKIDQLQIALNQANATIGILTVTIQTLTSENVDFHVKNANLCENIKSLEIVNKRQHDTILQLEKKLKIDSSNS